MNEKPQAPYSATTSLWPALSIVIVAVAMLVIFTLINVVFDRGVKKTSLPVAPIVVGVIPKSGEPSPALSACSANSSVPKDIQTGFVWPVKTQLLNAQIVNSGAGDFDCRVTFVSQSASAQQVLWFFKGQLTASGWNYFSSGATNGDPQYLFQKAGSDTFYWVIGVTVTQHAGSTTQWVFRAYQNSSAI